MLIHHLKDYQWILQYICVNKDNFTRRIIILIMRLHSEQIRNENKMDTIELSPEKEEWAIINKYKAIEFERIKAKERSIDREKKQSFRRQLDNQLNSRNNAELKQREMDRLYYQQLSLKSNELKRKEEMDKYNKFLTRKTIEQQNSQKIEANRASRLRDFDTGYHLDIGMQSEHEHKQKTELFKKDMMDTLDLQLKEKSEQAKKQRVKIQQMQELHKQMQENYFKPSQKKIFNQNQKIYDYYQRLEHDRQLREKELEVKLVDEAMERVRKNEDQRLKMEEMKKLQDKQIVKHTLDEQVRHGHRKRVQQNKINPQQISYGFISNMFRQKEQFYDKETYKRELQRQAEEQRQRKIKQNHMNQEEYRFNMNQLSKAVIGSYTQKDYLDRSLGSIGDHKRLELNSLKYDLKDKDADVIKVKLQNLRNKGTTSYVEQRHF